MESALPEMVGCFFLFIVYDLWHADDTGLLSQNADGSGFSYYIKFCIVIALPVYYCLCCGACLRFWALGIF